MVAMGSMYLYLKQGTKGDITEILFFWFFSLLLLFIFVVFQFITSYLKNHKQYTNLKIRTQVGFYDGSCSHIMHFFTHNFVSMETVVDVSCNTSL